MSNQIGIGIGGCGIERRCQAQQQGWQMDFTQPLLYYSARAQLIDFGGADMDRVNTIIDYGTMGNDLVPRGGDLAKRAYVKDGGHNLGAMPVFHFESSLMESVDPIPWGSDWLGIVLYARWDDALQWCNIFESGPRAVLGDSMLFRVGRLSQNQMTWDRNGDAKVNPWTQTVNEWFISGCTQRSTGTARFWGMWNGGAPGWADHVGADGTTYTTETAQLLLGGGRARIAEAAFFDYLPSTADLDDMLAQWLEWYPDYDFPFTPGVTYPA